MKKQSKRIISLLLCLCMMFGVLSLAACDEGGGEIVDLGTPIETDEDGKPATVTAYRALRSLPAGYRLRGTDFQEVTVSAADIPEGTILERKGVFSKYLTTDVVAGEYLLEGKVSDVYSVGGADGSGLDEDFIIVTEHINMNGDIAAQVQALIDSNPNRTLYFPDGIYKFDKSIITPADPAKTVSLRLSNYAIFMPTTKYKGEDGKGLVRLGAGAAAKDASSANAVGSGFYFMGGMVNMTKDASAQTSYGTAISVEGGRDVLITNFALKGTYVGIHIKTDHVDVDSGVIAGIGTTNLKNPTIGVLVESSYNTINNMRICSITRGIMLTEGNNVLRNLHPLYTTTNDPNSAGFWDESSGNFFDYCYSDNFALGFHLGDGNSSVLNGCFAFWYNASPNIHWGLRQDGAFNSIIRNTRFDVCHSEVDNGYIVTGTYANWTFTVKDTGGTGKISDAIGGAQSQAEHSACYNKYAK